MGKLTAKQVIAYSKADPKKYSDGEGLYFCVRKQGSPYWMIRYTTSQRKTRSNLGAISFNVVGRRCFLFQKKCRRLFSKGSTRRHRPSSGKTEDRVT
ncbi:Arm DNA-binding domain-containing protein [Alteromonas sp. BMJM2]|uniref:Arm DNA-binding domain-containing protein n=1 Tax=Alteromonas sp. BMJM2 TaxID=2954241 RepID=UPI003FA4640B